MECFLYNQNLVIFSGLIQKLTYSKRKMTDYSDKSIRNKLTLRKKCFNKDWPYYICIIFNVQFWQDFACAFGIRFIQWVFRHKLQESWEYFPRVCVCKFGQHVEWWAALAIGCLCVDSWFWLVDLWNTNPTIFTIIKHILFWVKKFQFL